MRIFLCLFFLPFIMAGCYGQHSQVVATQDTSLQVRDPYSWDFGQVKEGAVLKHDFVFKNDSRKTIIIKDITTSCGCTVSQVKNKTILPGEDTIIQVQFDTKGYFGKTEQFVYLHTDDLDNPIIRFIIKADITKN